MLRFISILTYTAAWLFRCLAIYYLPYFSPVSVKRRNWAGRWGPARITSLLQILIGIHNAVFIAQQLQTNTAIAISYLQALIHPFFVVRLHRESCQRVEQIARDGNLAQQQCSRTHIFPLHHRLAFAVRLRVCVELAVAIVGWLVTISVRIWSKDVVDFVEFCLRLGRVAAARCHELPGVL